MHHGVSECGCPFAIIPQKNGGVVFDELDSNEEYFPVVSRYHDQAFLGVPPKSIRPTSGITPEESWEDQQGNSPKSSQDGVADIPVDDHADALRDNRNVTSDHINTALGVPRNDEANDDKSVTPKLEPPIGPELPQPCTEGSKMQIKQSNFALRSHNQELRAAGQSLQLKDQQLTSTLDALENKEIELRQAKAESETEIQRLSSIVEDLRGENQQLQETGAEHEAQVAELSSTIENLHTEIQQLRQSQTEIQAQHDHLTNESQQHLRAASREVQISTEKSMVPQKQSQEVKQENEEAEALRYEVHGLKRSNESLQTEVKQAREDRNSMASTLTSLSDMMQGVLNLRTREQMVPLLQGVKIGRAHV